MANRYMYEVTQTFEKRPVKLFANVSIGATGAPTLNSGSRGIASITRVSAGKYDVVLEDIYQKLLAASFNLISTTGTDAALEMLVAADSSSNTTTPKVTIQFAVAAGTATDISNGAKLLLKLELRNSSAPV
jgi:hypothetical protein